jgi:valyl-tRNA synthetase
VVRALRNARAERKTEASVWMEARIYAGSILEQMRTLVPLIENLSRTRIISVQNRESRMGGGDSQEAVILTDAEVVLTGVNAAEADRNRQLLLKEAESARARLEGVEQRLANEVFLSRAPVDVVARQRELAASLQDKLTRLGTELDRLR